MYKINYLITGTVMAAVIAFSAAGCSTTDNKDGDASGNASSEKGIRSALADIKSVYEPVPCFDADFNVTIDSRREGRQNGRGKVYGDNINDRMHLVVTDAVIGIVISRVTVAGGFVHIDTLGEKTQVRPLSDFVTGNMSRNAISLPFAAFKDMIMGRIPEPVYSAKGKQEMHNQTLRVVLSEPAEDYYYDFIDNRLRKMTYVSRTGSYVMMDLEGRYEQTPFPQIISIKSQTAGGEKDLGENLRIAFRKINTETAACPDSLFVIPGQNR